MRMSPAVLVLIGPAIALGACSAGGGAATYGPAGSQFTASFPASPKTIHMPASAEQGLPAGTKGTFFGVGDLHIGVANSSPHVPTFGVVVELVPGANGADEAAHFMTAFGAFAKSSGGHPVTVGGASGWEIFTSEKAATGGDNGDSKARAGEIFVSRGNTIYVVGAFSDSQADVHAFVTSFKPA
ncbi:MAG: hypothetical protein ACYDGN_15620 [Acidimicrobiales bacterium]